MIKLKLKLIWHVLRGKPLIYGCHFKKGIELTEGKDVYVVKNTLGQARIEVLEQGHYPKKPGQVGTPEGWLAQIRSFVNK